jgi:hypothetical protein
MLKPHMIGRNGQRGRPRRVEVPEGGLGSVLRVRRSVEDGVLTLQFTGTADLANLLTLRDVSFTAIGERPFLLCLDMRMVTAVEIATINTLVTIARVAGMVGVHFALIPSNVLRDTLEQTGLTRLLPPLDDFIALSETDEAEDLEEAEPPAESDARETAEARSETGEKKIQNKAVEA